jgi:hypothetical protein
VDPISLLAENFSALAASNSPVFIVQLAMIAIGTTLVFLVLFATRDILLRTHSLLYQVFCILIVAALPILGFLVYLLIRPTSTCAERQLRHDIEQILSKFASHPKKRPPQTPPQDKGTKKSA